MRDGSPIPDDVLRDTPKMPNLPIDVVPNTTPPKFRWRQVVDTIVGKKTVDHEGVLPPSVERVVFELVGIARQLVTENDLLKKKVDDLTAELAKMRPSAPKPAPVVVK